MTNFGIIISLLIGSGLLFVIRSKSSQSSLSLHWVGYALLIMTVFLIVIGIISNLNEASHYQ
ncbi:hypothetical protein D7M11_35180 [Paenibacillus ginsengarvi]|uniref:Uncharacterized protein n=1 Tax=Paenibacillus ginsengarvi TaxID=400777 RepID=A0A3B0ARN2_9BACL|nr:hypothetical protein D7M11_35180 [Paenibacillus ginsengarvi]